MSVPSDRHPAPAPTARVVDIDPSWLDFGPDDPLEGERWLNACASCREQPILELVDLPWQDAPLFVDWTETIFDGFFSTPEALAAFDEVRQYFVELIADRRRSLILGAHAVGENAVEVIQSVTTAMAAGIDVAALANVRFAYPTYTAIVGLAARAVLAEPARGSELH